MCMLRLSSNIYGKALGKTKQKLKSNSLMFTSCTSWMYKMSFFISLGNIFYMIASSIACSNYCGQIVWHFSVLDEKIMTFRHKIISVKSHPCSIEMICNPDAAYKTNFCISFKLLNIEKNKNLRLKRGKDYDF